jgi:hypothetical protein
MAMVNNQMVSPQIPSQSHISRTSLGTLLEKCMERSTPFLWNLLPDDKTLQRLWSTGGQIPFFGSSENGLAHILMFKQLSSPIFPMFLSIWMAMAHQVHHPASWTG